MQTIVSYIIECVLETRQLDSLTSSTENTFYPAIKNLISAILKESRLPFEVRVNTSEAKGKARDMPDFVLGDDKMFVGVYGDAQIIAKLRIEGFQEGFIEIGDRRRRRLFVDRREGHARAEERAVDAVHGGGIGD